MMLGTRASALATTQARWVAGQLRARHEDIDIVTVSTEGDRSSAPLTQIGGTGVFASAIRTALRRREIDLAVHSLKDLPVAAEPGLQLAAIPPREDPRDVVISAHGRHLDDLPPGATVGTGSPRRAGQLALLAGHLRVVDIRGNVDTRIGKVRSGELDAVVLAAAGVRRLGRAGEVTHVLDLEQMLPAPGQGALAVECRSADGHGDAAQGEVDDRTQAACAALDDAVTRDCVSAERSMLAHLEAGCTAPVGAFAELDPEGGYRLMGWAGFDGRSARATATGIDPVMLGRHVAEQLLHQIFPELPNSILVTERES